MLPFRGYCFRLFGLLFLLVGGSPVWGADQPQWGEKGTRNLVSAERGLPDRFDPATGENILWTAELGSQTWSTPVISGGKVLVGTNNDPPRHERYAGDSGVLNCLDEATGRLCWQLVMPKMGDDPFHDWPQTGLVSPATVEGDRIYLLGNRNEVMCLDPAGMANGNQGPYLDEAAHMALGGNPKGELVPEDGDILWLFDVPRELGTHQHDAAHCSILADGPYLYLCTSNGVSNDHKQMVCPDAPSLVVLEKATGRLVARDEERMGRMTIHNVWSSPSVGEVSGRRLIFFCGGDGVCYAFEPLDPDRVPAEPVALKRVWRFDLDTAAPKQDIFRFQENRKESPSNVFGMPVFHGGRVYVAVGGDYWHGKLEAWLKCIDASQTGDVTESALVWSYPLEKHVFATPAVADGLVYIADCGRRIHCVDIATGQAVWTQETKGETWSSPLVADGKVYVATRRGEFWILAAGREKRELARIDLDEPVNGSPMAANGTLYVTTMSKLYAVKAGTR